LKKLISFTLILCLLAAQSIPAQAADLLSAYAGRLLGDIIALISDEYAGEDEICHTELVEMAIRGMTLLLDSYSVYLNEEELEQLTDSLSGRFTGIGVSVFINDDEQAEISRVFPDTPAREAGLKRGDIITGINQAELQGLTLDEVISHIGQAESTVNLQVLRGGKSLRFTIQKREIQTASIYVDTLDEVLGHSVKGHEAIRYIAVSSITDQASAVFKDIVQDLQKEKIDKIILDLRGNTGGYLDEAIAMCEQIVPAGAICHIVDGQGNKVTRSSRLRQPPFSQVVVLIDRYTASAAELIAAALQDADAAIIVGEKSFGKGAVQSLYYLPTGGGLKLTTEEYLRRSGEKINNIGVTPDYIVDFDEENDPSDDIFLLKALELLK
jgi:carboxyl-terminal processing protease